VLGVDERLERASLASTIAAFLALPAVVAYALPIGLGLGAGAGIVPWGLGVAAVGTVAVIRTVIDFFTRGHGTLAPWDPPRELVTTGLFAWCRNPMYIGVLVTITGWAVTFRSIALAGYSAAAAFAFHVRVVLVEEPWASETFPDDWPNYRQQVPRWLPCRPTPTHRSNSD